MTYVDTKSFSINQASDRDSCSDDMGILSSGVTRTDESIYRIALMND